MKSATCNGIRRSLWLCAFVLALNSHPASAAGVNIVAFGASDTLGSGPGRGKKSAGNGVSEGDAFPAQLEAMLRTKGVDAHISNEGVPGDTTGGMLGRLDAAVPSDAQIVLLEVPSGNDRKIHLSAAETDRNVAQIKAALRARHIKVIYIGPTNNGAITPNELNGDHPNKIWHTALATKLLPQVLAALGH
jgi:acyl-CoA thioesterase I